MEREIERVDIWSKKPSSFHIKADSELKNVIAHLVSGVNNLSKKFDAYSALASRSTGIYPIPVMKVE